MTEQGLYGHVIAAGRRSSRVLQLQDINSRIAVLTPRTEARAIMIGTNRAMPVLSYIDDKMDWQDGDIVMTSGDEGVLPQGLPIGVVRKNQDKQFLVELYSDKAIKDWVYVFSFTPILPPEMNPSEGPVEGERRGAGDSEAAPNAQSELDENEAAAQSPADQEPRDAEAGEN